MTTSRNWLVLFINSEVLRRYQWPVGVERVLGEHIAAVGAIPITEGMDTCAAPIAAHAADTQAGEAGIAGPQARGGMTGMKGKTVHIRRKPLFCNKRFWLLRRRDEANIRTFEL